VKVTVVAPAAPINDSSISSEVSAMVIRGV